jgi:enoyl-CoA hydratase/carnithine racemase
MSYEFITTERRGNILQVTLNRPEVYNAMHPPMHHELAQVWDAYSADADLWVAVLTGAGDKAFTAGNDLKFTAAGGKSNMPPSGFAGLTQRFDLEKPIIAAVNGFAMGGGFETATFALPEVKVGFFAAAGGVQRLSRYIGRLAAQELVLTGRSITAQEALALGVVNAVVPKAELPDAAMAKAAQITAVSPSAVRASKRVLNALAVAEGLPDSLAYSREVVTDLAQTEDFKEGVQAFVEKRKPKWLNR